MGKMIVFEAKDSDELKEMYHKLAAKGLNHYSGIPKLIERGTRFRIQDLSYHDKDRRMKLMIDYLKRFQEEKFNSNLFVLGWSPTQLEDHEVHMIRLLLESMGFSFKSKTAISLANVPTLFSYSPKAPLPIGEVFKENYVGSSFPEIVLAGDKRSSRAMGPWAFCGNQKSSKLLHSALFATGVNEAFGVGIYNANGRHGDSITDWVVKVNGGRPVIALGREAEASLDRQGVKSIYVPHPSYWLRFDKGDVYSYKKHLIEAISEIAQSLV